MTQRDPLQTNPKIALIGPGAIGTTVAAALHETGRTPTLCGRTAHAQLSLRFEDERIVVPGPVRTRPEEITDTYDLVFVAVKSTQIDAAAPWLSVLCNEKTVVCVLQNGVEQKQLFAP
jgi:2-dehydropantoate 2-reductase